MQFHRLVSGRKRYHKSTSSPMPPYRLTPLKGATYKAAHLLKLLKDNTLQTVAMC